MSQPASMVRMVWTQAALALLGLITTVLTLVLEDDLVRSWAQGRASLRETLASGGVEAVRTGDIAPPAFVPVAVVLFVVLVMLVWVLVAFVRLGYGWARLTLTGLLVFMAVATVAGIRTDPPTVFVVLAVMSFVIDGLAIVFLWHRDTTAYMRGTWSSTESEVDVPA